MRLITISVLFSFLISCDDRYTTIDSIAFKLNENTYKSDTIIKDTVDGKLFSRLYKPESYGVMYQHYLKKEVIEKEMKVVFSGKIRTNYAFSNAAINVSVGSKAGNPLGWSGKSLRYHFTDINTWCPFKDSVKLKHESWQEPYYVINVFSFLGNSMNEKFDLKDLNIQIKLKD